MFLSLSSSVSVTLSETLFRHWKIYWKQWERQFHLRKTHACTLSLSHTHTHTHTLSHTHSLTHTLSHTNTHTHTHMRTYTHVHEDERKWENKIEKIGSLLLQLSSLEWIFYNHTSQRSKTRGSPEVLVWSAPLCSHWHWQNFAYLRSISSIHF